MDLDEARQEFPIGSLIKWNPMTVPNPHVVSVFSVFRVESVEKEGRDVIVRGKDRDSENTMHSPPEYIIQADN